VKVCQEAGDITGPLEIAFAKRVPLRRELATPDKRPTQPLADA
jgi:hypothetical protein